MRTTLTRRLLAGGTRRPRMAYPRVVSAALVVLCFLGFATSGSAALLNFSGGNPDISAAFVYVSYDHVDDRFLATGMAMNFHVENPTNDFGIENGSFTLDVVVNDLGEATGGYFTVQGKIPDLGINSIQTLLSGNLVTVPGVDNFGYQGPPGGTIFQFRFDDIDPTSALASYYSGMVGVTIDASFLDPSFNGYFTDSFNNIAAYGFFSATADITPEVPEPASWMVWLSSAMGVAGIVSRRARQRGRKLRPKD